MLCLLHITKRYKVIAPSHIGCPSFVCCKFRHYSCLWTEPTLLKQYWFCIDRSSVIWLQHSLFIFKYFTVSTTVSSVYSRPAWDNKPYFYPWKICTTFRNCDIFFASSAVCRLYTLGGLHWSRKHLNRKDLHLMFYPSP